MAGFGFFKATCPCHICLYKYVIFLVLKKRGKNAYFISSYKKKIVRVFYIPPYVPSRS